MKKQRRPLRCPTVRRLALLCMCLTLIGAGPGRAEAESSVGRYFKNRGNDLMDIIGLRFSMARRGHGFGALVRATALVQAGGIYFDGYHAGLDRRAVGVWRERRLQGAIGPFAAVDIETAAKRGNDFAFERGPWSEHFDRGIIRNGQFWDDGREHPLALGVEVQPGILPGVEARLHPVELFDFVFGLAGLDIQRDDLKRSAQRKPPETADDEATPEQAPLVTPRTEDEPAPGEPDMETPIFQEQIEDDPAGKTILPEPWEEE